MSCSLTDHTQLITCHAYIGVSYFCTIGMSRPWSIDNNLVEAHCYGIGRTGQIVEQSRSSEKQIEM